MLDIDNLSTTFFTNKGDIHAVQNVSFSIARGQSIGIAGESACGKSTLGLSIIRMLQGGKITSGDISFNGKSLLNLDDKEFNKKIRWKEIAMIFQGAMNSLDPVFTINQQFTEILKQHNFQGNYTDTISSAVTSVDLDVGILDKYPHELSGGMKQRIIIAMCLLLNPKFIIADEPTTALDVLTQAQIINLLKQSKNKGMSIMLISHDLAVLSEIADNIGIMYGGQLVELGPSSEIYNNPKHPYTKALLKSIPTLKGARPSYIKGVPPSLINPSTQCRFIDRCPCVMEKCKTDPPIFKKNSSFVKCWLYE